MRYGISSSSGGALGLGLNWDADEVSNFFDSQHVLLRNPKSRIVIRFPQDSGVSFSIIK